MHEQAEEHANDQAGHYKHRFVRKADSTTTSPTVLLSTAGSARSLMSAAPEDRYLFAGQISILLREIVVRPVRTNLSTGRLVALRFGLMGF